jgi:hypothetical protein
MKCCQVEELLVCQPSRVIQETPRHEESLVRLLLVVLQVPLPGMPEGGGDIMTSHHPMNTVLCLIMEAG